MLIGGKAENLIFLQLNGLPVPPFKVIPADVDDDLIPRMVEEALQELASEMRFDRVAVRSSAVGEDSEKASFAGVNETLLNVPARPSEVAKAVLRVRRGTERAKIYAKRLGVEASNIAVIIMPMIDARVAGVVFTVDPVTGEDDIVIEAVNALGEELVSGRRNPTRYIVSKTGKIVSRHGEDILDDETLKQLASYAREIEALYKKPMDIEFAVDEGGIWILQARPITVVAKKEKKIPKIEGRVVIKGVPASPGIARGRIVIPSRPEDVREGDIMVIKFTSPDWLPAMQRAAAIVTDVGGVLSHAAIVARELGIPAVVGTGDATEKLRGLAGREVIVNGYTGEVILPVG